jgi:hypothetical protein
MEVVNGIRNHWAEIVEIAQTVGKLIIFWWENTWGRILNFAIQNWGKISAVITAVLSNIMIEIRGVMKTIQGIFDVVMGIIHGDWGRAWKGIKEIVDGTLGTILALVKNTLTRLVPAVLGLAVAIGVAILKGIANGLLNLASWLYTKVTTGTESALRSVAGAIGGAAAAIGRAIVDGIIAGTVGLVGRLGSAIGNAAKGALGFAKRAIGASSPSKLAADEVGKPIGEGIIVGFLLGSADLPSKISQKVKDSLEAGKKVVDGYVDKFKTAFSRLADEALLAFDRMTEKFQTTHEKLLAAFDLKQATIEAKKQMDELVKAVTDAQLALQMQASQGVPQLTRQEGESDADFYARQEEARQKFNDDQAALLQTYNAAVAALDEERHKRQLEKQRATLEAQATKERANYEERRRLQRISLTDELNQLETFLLEHPKMHNRTQKLILKLLNDYGVQYYAAGRNTGIQFAKGLEGSMGEVLQRAHEIAEAVAAVLKTASPTKEGPMSTLDHWWDSFGQTLVKGLDTDPIRRAALGMAGAMQANAGGGLAFGQSGASTMGAGAVTYVTYNVQGSLIREQDLNDRVREAVNTEYRRGRTVST